MSSANDSRTPDAWIYTKLINKHVTGPLRPNQITLRVGELTMMGDVSSPRVAITIPYEDLPYVVDKWPLFKD